MRMVEWGISRFFVGPLGGWGGVGAASKLVRKVGGRAGRGGEVGLGLATRACLRRCTSTCLVGMTSRFFPSTLTVARWFPSWNISVWTGKGSFVDAYGGNRLAVLFLDIMCNLNLSHLSAYRLLPCRKQEFFRSMRGLDTENLTWRVGLEVLGEMVGNYKYFSTKYSVRT